MAFHDTGAVILLDEMWQKMFHNNSITRFGAGAKLRDFFGTTTAISIREARTGGDLAKLHPESNLDL
jgi:hypothetical protein